MKKNGIFLFVVSHLVPEIFKIFVLCKLGTDDVIRCVTWKSKHKIENISACNDAKQLEFWARHATFLPHERLLYTKKCAT